MLYVENDAMVNVLIFGWTQMYAHVTLHLSQPSIPRHTLSHAVTMMYLFIYLLLYCYCYYCYHHNKYFICKLSPFDLRPQSLLKPLMYEWILPITCHCTLICPFCTWFVSRSKCSTCKGFQCQCLTYLPPTPTPCSNIIQNADLLLVGVAAQVHCGHGVQCLTW
jgi:hypothetical protein